MCYLSIVTWLPTRRLKECVTLFYASALFSKITFWKSFFFFSLVLVSLKNQNISLKCWMNGGRFWQPQTSALPFFCLDYDANIATNKQRNNCNGRHGALPYKSLERFCTFLDHCWAERNALACSHRYLNYAQSIVSTFRKVMRERPHAPHPPTPAEIIIYVAAELQRDN